MLPIGKMLVELSMLWALISALDWPYYDLISPYGGPYDVDFGLFLCTKKSGRNKCFIKAKSIINKCCLTMEIMYLLKIHKKTN